MALVLIVDDESMIRELYRDILEMANHRVIEAADGVEGLARYIDYRPDVTITDILMPRSGGLQLISEVRKIDPAARIIAISGGGRDGKLNFLTTAKTFPGIAALKKPCPRGELLSAISELLSPGNNCAAHPCAESDRCRNLAAAG